MDFPRCKTLRFENTSKHYDHRVKWFTTKNKKKRIKMFRRSSKRMTKTRQITPHAMCRHMVSGKTHLRSRHVADQRCGERKTRSDRMREEGHQRYRFRQRELVSPPLLPNQSMRLICYFLSFCDPISTEWSVQVHQRQTLTTVQLQLIYLCWSHFNYSQVKRPILEY